MEWWMRAGDKMTLLGSGTIAKQDLIEAYNLIYVTDPTGDYYYYDDGTTTHKLDSNSDAQWATLLGKTGLNGFDATLNADGSVSFTFDQEFTVASETAYDGTTFTVETTQEIAYGVDLSDPNAVYSFMVSPDGQAQVTKQTTFMGNSLIYDTGSGEFKSINGGNAALLDFKESAQDIMGNAVDLSHFSDVSIDFTASSMYNNNGTLLLYPLFSSNF